MSAREVGVTVAIDGPAGAGKSTVAKAVAFELGYRLVDTGAIYRAVALLARRRDISWTDDVGLRSLVAGLDIEFRWAEGVNRVLVEGEDVSVAIRTPEISQGASIVSARPVVRAGLLELQRRLAGRGGAVLEGRDIGTVVCPGAPVKFFLDATREERARRRQRELAESGSLLSEAEVLAEMDERDARDRERAVAPLKPAPDAVIIDSTRASVGEVVQRIVEAARAKELERRRQRDTSSR
jgi:cytidylate kinase